MAQENTWHTHRVCPSVLRAVCWIIQPFLAKVRSRQPLWQFSPHPPPRSAGEYLVFSPGSPTGKASGRFSGWVDAAMPFIPFNLSPKTTSLRSSVSLLRRPPRCLVVGLRFDTGALSESNVPTVSLQSQTYSVRFGTWVERRQKEALSEAPKGPHW